MARTYKRRWRQFSEEQKERRRAYQRVYSKLPEVKARRKLRRHTAKYRAAQRAREARARQRRASERQQQRQVEAYERGRLEQLRDPAYVVGNLKPNDPRVCRCGAKLSFLVDMYGQTYEQCDACGHYAHFGRHPIKDAA